MDSAKKRWRSFPPFSARNAEKDGAPSRYLVAGSISDLKASRGAGRCGREKDAMGMKLMKDEG
jgi:hypothetical protein